MKLETLETEKYTDWYDSNFENNLIAFIEDDKNIEIVENMYIHAQVLDPNVKDDGWSDFYDRNIVKIAKSYFKHNKSDELSFEIYCDKLYESKDEIDEDSIYEANRDR
jgi:hypothetical protein